MKSKGCSLSMYTCIGNAFYYRGHKTSLVYDIKRLTNTFKAIFNDTPKIIPARQLKKHSVDIYVVKQKDW